MSAISYIADQIRPTRKLSSIGILLFMHEDNNSGYRALRKGRVSAPGQIYFVTTVVRGRMPLFLSPDLARAACRVLGAHSTARGLETLCWVLMPDHMHLLVCLQQGDLSKRVGYLKARMAHAVNRERGTSMPVWQRGFHEHAVRREEDLRVIGRYVVSNPIRAGLVDSVGMYPYWNAAWI